MTSDIFIYYEELGFEAEAKLVKLWKEVWESHGWNAHILNRDNAKLHPRYEEVRAKARSLPTENYKDYEIACFVRWCAFAQINGVAADYDVFPIVPYLPRPFPPGLVNGDETLGPGFIHGAAQDHERFVSAIIGYVPDNRDTFKGRPHVSDLHVSHHVKGLYSQTIRITACYGVPDWKSYPVIHYSNGYLPPGRARIDVVMENLAGVL